jgi:hypothetical protein
VKLFQVLIQKDSNALFYWLNVWNATNFQSPDVSVPSVVCVDEDDNAQLRTRVKQLLQFQQRGEEDGSIEVIKLQ